MPIEIMLTSEPVQIDALLKMRHKVFSEEENKFPPTADGRLLDRFDAYPSTRNLVVLADGEVVGGLRLTLDSGVGLPADDYYDFRSHLPQDSRLLNAGMYCVTKPFRSPRIALGLILMASYYGISQDVTHVVAPVNPAIAKLLHRVGFEAIDDEVVEPNGLVILPMVIDVKNLGDFFAKFVQNNQLHNFIHSYECYFYSKGEYVVHKGEQANSAFVIVDGAIDVIDPKSGEILASMGEGEVFGELALLIDDVRTADVIASSDLRIMSLPRDEFLAHLRSNPDSAMMMLRSMGRRLRDML